jgi:hypothetical protein
MAQTLLTGLIVFCSALYVLWTLLLPATARRRVAQTLLRRHWSAVVAARLQAQAKADCACACKGCARGPALAQPPATQPVHWATRHRR